MLGIIGTINEPQELNSLGGLEGGGVGSLLNLVLNILIVGAAIYTLFNFVFAGYTFLSAGGDAKKIEMAWAKIWQSILGLTIAAGAFILAAIFGYLIFGNPSFILNPTISTPNPTISTPSPTITI